MALRDVGLVWLILAAQPLAAPRLGAAGAATLTFGTALAWLVATRSRAAISGGWRGRGFLGGILAGYLGLPAICLVSALVARLVGVPLGTAVARGGAPLEMLPALFVLAPAFEELLYRERLLGALAGSLPHGLAVVVSGAAFAFPHAEPRVALAAFLTGVGLASLWLRTRSLALCIGVHAGLNLGVQVDGVLSVAPSTSTVLRAGAAGLVLRCVMGTSRP